MGIRKRKSLVVKISLPSRKRTWGKSVDSAEIWIYFWMCNLLGKKPSLRITLHMCWNVTFVLLRKTWRCSLSGRENETAASGIITCIIICIFTSSALCTSMHCIMTMLSEDEMEIHNFLLAFPVAFAALFLWPSLVQLINFFRDMFRMHFALMGKLLFLNKRKLSTLYDTILVKLKDIVDKKMVQLT